ncbi:MAG TPA: glycosyltransferase family 2 protein [Stenotrophomonas sp.]|nr:glycosyltransferase family 2 protein [Stenotrophomonas sp.]
MESRVAVIIPAYKVKAQVLDVIGRIGPEVARIYVVDDCCPEGSGDFVEANCGDPRVKVVRNPENLGVGGAVMNGYIAAIADRCDVLVKVDGDGQMDPALIDGFIEPILSGEADYTKGNRFYDLSGISAMPKLRLFGNAGLSFLAKLSSGYWDLFDPTNGYTAIHAQVARHLPFGKISKRYFFETDMLFHLNILRAVVVDVPMHAKYEDEVSNLKISKIFGEFLYKHARNFCRRVFYNYYLRGMSVASLELPLGLLLVIVGVGYGGYHWAQSMRMNVETAAGTVMAAALPVIIGIQMLLAFVGYDMASVPRRPLHPRARAPLARHR